ncbi:MAG: hypothetical protein ACTSVY_11380 [Candidatus Helarchaeota archaeon]
MIQNILVIKHGIPLVVENFGQCHSIDTKSSLFSGFLEAFVGFSSEISETKMKSINFEDILILLKVKNELLFIIIANIDDDINILNKVLKKIIELFSINFGDFVSLDKVNSKVFKSFRNIILENELVRSICDETDHCEYCPTIEEEKELESIYKKIQFLVKDL